MSPSAEDRAGYRAPRPLKANARTQYFVDCRRVSKSQFDRSQGYGGFAAAMSQHRAAEAQHRAAEAQHGADGPVAQMERGCFEVNSLPFVPCVICCSTSFVPCVIR